MCKRSERLLYIDTYSVLAPKGQLERHLFPKTDPSGVHYNKTGKIKVLSKIVATLVKEKAGTVDGENNSQQLSVNTSDISRVGVHTKLVHSVLDITTLSQNYPTDVAFHLRLRPKDKA